MSTAERILEKWLKPYKRKAYILDFPGSQKTALVIVNGQEYFVQVEYDGVPIDEEFSSVRLYSENGYLRLSCSEKNNLKAFASFCSIFAEPGDHDVNRDELLKSPVLWWKEWKSLLGNTNTGSMVYDVIGELYVLKKLLKDHPNYKGLIIWNGPKHSTKDIETPDAFYEVKSTVIRDRKEIAVHGIYQLDAYDRELNLVLCTFEPCSSKGETINSLVNDLVKLGYDPTELEALLAKRGYSKNKSARNIRFNILSADKYEVDDSFPKITKECFVGGDLPDHIVKVDYVIDLSGLSSIDFKIQP